MKIDKLIFYGIPAEFGETCNNFLSELQNDKSNLEFGVSNYIYRTSSGGALELNANANPVTVWFRFGGMESFCAIEAKKLPRGKSCLTILMAKAGKSQDDPWESCSSEEGKESWLRLKTVWELLKAELEGWIEEEPIAVDKLKLPEAPEEGPDDQPGRKNNGRSLWIEDVWAWAEVNIHKCDKDEVRSKWKNHLSPGREKGIKKDLGNSYRNAIAVKGRQWERELQDLNKQAPLPRNISEFERKLKKTLSFIGRRSKQR